MSEGERMYKGGDIERAGETDAGSASLYSQVGLDSSSRSSDVLTTVTARKKIVVLATIVTLLIVAMFGINGIDDTSITGDLDDVDAEDFDKGDSLEEISHDIRQEENFVGETTDAQEEVVDEYEEPAPSSEANSDDAPPPEEIEAAAAAAKGLSHHHDPNIPDWLAAANLKAHLPSKLTAADHPADPCHNMRKAWEDMPYDFAQSDREIIIGAGEGATGTSFASNLVRKLGYTTAHWNHANSDSKTLKEWKHVLAKLLNVQPYEREHFNFDVVPKKVDGIFDTPVANLFPYLFKAYPKAKVILTTRTPAQWIVSRTRRSYLQSYPSTYQRASILQEMKNPAAVTDRKRPQATMLQYEMFNLMVRCIVPKDQLLEMDVIETPNDIVIEKMTSFIGPKKKKG